MNLYIYIKYETEKFEEVKLREKYLKICHTSAQDAPLERRRNLN